VTVRWWCWSVETGRDNLRGPWGPVEAATRDDAERIARRRLASSGLTLDRVEQIDEPGELAEGP